MRTKLISIALLVCISLCSCSKGSTDNKETVDVIIPPVDYSTESILHANPSGLYFTIAHTGNTEVISVPSKKHVEHIDIPYSTLTLVTRPSTGEQAESGIEKIFYVSTDSKIIEQFIKIRQQGVDLKKDIVLHCKDVSMADILTDTQLMSTVNSMMFMSLTLEDYKPKVCSALDFINQCLSQPDDFEKLSKMFGFTDKAYTDIRDAATDYLYCNVPSGRILIKV